MTDSNLGTKDTAVNKTDEILAVIQLLFMWGGNKLVHV